MSRLWFFAANKISASWREKIARISHTFSVSYNKRLTFLCIWNGKTVVHIALITHGFYHFAKYNATKIFLRTEEVCQKTNNHVWIILLPTGVRSINLCEEKNEFQTGKKQTFQWQEFNKLFVRQCADWGCVFLAFLPRIHAGSREYGWNAAGNPERMISRTLYLSDV